MRVRGTFRPGTLSSIRRTLPGHPAQVRPILLPALRYNLTVAHQPNRRTTIPIANLSHTPRGSVQQVLPGMAPAASRPIQFIRTAPYREEPCFIMGPTQEAHTGHGRLTATGYRINMVELQELP